MKRTDPFTKILAVIGTILAWFPLLAPVLLSAALLITEGIFRFDYLMPAELFFFALAGGLLLLWAAFRARSQVKLIGWSLLAAVGILVLSQVVAVVTGLASGAIEATGWQWILVLAMLFIFILALIAVAVGGILLLRNLFSKQPPEST